MSMVFSCLANNKARRITGRLFPDSRPIAIRLDGRLRMHKGSRLFETPDWLASVPERGPSSEIMWRTGAAGDGGWQAKQACVCKTLNVTFQLRRICRDLPDGRTARRVNLRRGSRLAARLASQALGRAASPRLGVIKVGNNPSSRSDGRG
jgi:hypothetical protein